MKVFIDAGHRNNSLDYGACSNGKKESALAISICHKIKGALEKYNIICYMSRVSEQDVISLTQRTIKANNLKVDLFLSIHINSASNVNATGVEVLYYSDFNLADNMAREVASCCHAINRGAKQRKDLHVLSASRMPALLVECGFISNAKECAKLSNGAYQDQIAEAIVDTILETYRIAIDKSVDRAYKNAIQSLYEEGIITDITAWEDHRKIKVENVPYLIKNMHQYIQGRT